LGVTATAEDDDQDSLTFQWFNADTSQFLTNGVTVYLDHPWPDYYPRYWAQIGDSALNFALGTHTISLVAFDGTFRVTNSAIVEVLSVPSAISRLITEVEMATRNPEESRLVSPLYLARDVAAEGGLGAAAEYLRQFQARVQDSTQLLPTMKTLYNEAAQKILNALPGG